MSNKIITKTMGTYNDLPVSAYTLSNRQGMQVSIMNLGATILEIIVPGKNGERNNVIRSFSSLEEYVQNSHYYSACIVGRFANRIAHGKFSLNGVEYQLAKNHGKHHLHGGVHGFHKAWWNALADNDSNSISFKYISKDGEEGYPGNLTVTVTYTLSEKNELFIHYVATTDQSTPVNLTSHAYFNLTGKPNTSILDHSLTLFAEGYTEADAELIPTGKILPLENTALDFSYTKKIGKDIESIGGYDHNFTLKKESGHENALIKAAILHDPLSGRTMEMFTTEPGFQMYTGKFLNTNSRQEEYAAICLEAQHFPDSPNHPEFPTTILHPGEKYKQTTCYAFSIA